MRGRRIAIGLALALLLGMGPVASAEDAPATGGEVTPAMRDAALKRMFTYLDENLWKLGEHGSTRKPYAAAVAGWAYLLCIEKVKDGKKLPSRKKQLDRIRGYLDSYAERVARGYEQADKRDAKKKKRDKPPKGPPGFERMMGMQTAQYVWPLGQVAHFHAESIARGKSKSASKKALKKVFVVLGAAQQENGGWGHDDAERDGMGLPPIQIPKPGGGSLTYPATLLAATSCALSGLGAASLQTKSKSVGPVLEAGKAYLLKSQNTNGTFPYDPSQKHTMPASGGGMGMAGGIEVARTSGAVLSLLLAGVEPSDAAIQKALRAIDASPDQLGDGHGSAAMALQYSAVLAAVRGGEAWATFRKTFFAKILAKQNEDGSCDCVCNESPGVTNDTKAIPGMPAGAGGGWVQGGRVYVTAIHALILALDRTPPKAIPSLKDPKAKVVTR
ncbi:MAG: hypothetical protein QNJ98_10565 [Planctomycetota bacterium]|nr:hypothetical protein [Planctomycetota bacterium]